MVDEDAICEALDRAKVFQTEVRAHVSAIGRFHEAGAMESAAMAAFKAAEANSRVSGEYLAIGRMLAPHRPGRVERLFGRLGQRLRRSTAT